MRDLPRFHPAATPEALNPQEVVMDATPSIRARVPQNVPSIVSKHMKCSALLAITEIKTTLRFHITAQSVAIIKKSSNRCQ